MGNYFQYELKDESHGRMYFILLISSVIDAPVPGLLLVNLHTDVLTLRLGGIRVHLLSLGGNSGGLARWNQSFKSRV